MEKEFRKILEQLDAEHNRLLFQAMLDSTEEQMHGVLEGLEIAIDIVTKLGAEYLADNSIGKYGWIDCEKKLPNIDDRVLVLADDKEIYIGRIYFYENCTGFGIDEDGWIDLRHITHWQPLPHVPKGRGWECEQGH